MTATVRTGRPTTITLPEGDSRQVFTRPAQDGINQGRPATYRVAQIFVYDDGSIWVWAEQLTKAGRAYKSGMGLTLGNEDRLAEIYGQDVADVVAEAVAPERASLSVAASAVARIHEGYATDPISGPGGLGSDTTWATTRALAALGWTPADFNAELAARTSDRFAFFSGLTLDEEPSR